MASSYADERCESLPATLPSPRLPAKTGDTAPNFFPAAPLQSASAGDARRAADAGRPQTSAATLRTASEPAKGIFRWTIHFLEASPSPPARNKACRARPHKSKAAPGSLIAPAPPD